MKYFIRHTRHYYNNEPSQSKAVSSTLTGEAMVFASRKDAIRYIDEVLDQQTYVLDHNQYDWTYTAIQVNRASQSIANWAYWSKPRTCEEWIEIEYLADY
jgi:hypothetical protein